MVSTLARYINKNRPPWQRAILAGLLLGVPFISPWFWWLGFFGVGVFLTLDSVKAAQRFWYGWLVGTIQSGFAIIWFWYTYPLSWVGVEGFWFNAAVIGGYWFTVSASLGLGYVALALVLPKLRNFTTRVQLWIIPGVWVVAEMVGSLTFSLYSLGPGAVPNIHFGFGYLGYLFAHNDVIAQAAKLGGVYVLTYIYVWVGMLVAMWWGTSIKKSFGLVALILLASVIAVPSPQAPNIVTGIHTQFNRYRDDSNFDFHTQFSYVRQQVETEISRGARVIVLPEDTRFIDGFIDEYAALDFLATRAPQDLVLVDTKTIKGSTTVLRAYVYDTKAMEVYTFDKEYLVPQGEFMPYLILWGLKLVTNETQYGNIIAQHPYRPGLSRSELDLPDYVPSVLFCSESVSPLLLRQRVKNDGTQLAVHPVSHGWFHDPKILWYQLNIMLEINSHFAHVPVVPAINVNPGETASK